MSIHVNFQCLRDRILREIKSGHDSRLDLAEEKTLREAFRTNFLAELDGCKGSTHQNGPEPPLQKKKQREFLVNLTLLRELFQVNSAILFDKEDELPASVRLPDHSGISARENVRVLSTVGHSFVDYAIKSCFSNDKHINHTATMALISACSCATDSDSGGFSQYFDNFTTLAKDSFQIPTESCYTNFQPLVQSFLSLSRWLRKTVNNNHSDPLSGLKLEITECFTLFIESYFSCVQEHKLYLPQVSSHRMFVLECHLKCIRNATRLFGDLLTLKAASSVVESLERFLCSSTTVINTIITDTTVNSYIMLKVLKTVLVMVSLHLAKPRIFQMNTIKKSWLESLLCNERLRGLLAEVLNPIFQEGLRTESMNKGTNLQDETKRNAFILLIKIIQLSLQFSEISSTIKPWSLQVIKKFCREGNSIPCSKVINLLISQDDDLFEALFSLLWIYEELHRSQEIEDELLQSLNPHYLFIEFLSVISFDTTLMLDYLIGKETSFTSYVECYLDAVGSNSDLFCDSLAALAAFKNNCKVCLKCHVFCKGFDSRKRTNPVDRDRCQLHPFKVHVDLRTEYYNRKEDFYSFDPGNCCLALDTNLHQIQNETTEDEVRIDDDEISPNLLVSYSSSETSVSMTDEECTDNPDEFSVSYVFQNSKELCESCGLYATRILGTLKDTRIQLESLSKKGLSDNISPSVIQHLNNMESQIDLLPRTNLKSDLTNS